MLDYNYEILQEKYPYCCRIQGTLRDYLTAREWAMDTFGRSTWTSTWTSDSRDYMDDQQRDWLFMFKSRDNYLLFMLTWHYV